MEAMLTMGWTGLILRKIPRGRHRARHQLKYKGRES
ncbi:hypothetical protein CIPAW_09G212200 [Carya illinoinensis]|uniref:Uncharacterized protein n=1 Tax=Carya illinoinensis TaxID=32201 RepID=A0A8T1PKN3_CARIL|nr:hypothetical protein CIPAW_09G212200 [Carya illinoinensis]